MNNANPILSDAYIIIFKLTTWYSHTYFSLKFLKIVFIKKAIINKENTENMFQIPIIIFIKIKKQENTKFSKKKKNKLPILFSLAILIESHYVII